MSYVLGIDVGTTRTAAAIGRTGARHGEIESVNLGDRSSAVPSVLYVGDDGSVVVGEAAERRATSDPDRVVREFKRRIGDPTPVIVAGRPWAPEELSARLVRWVVDRVAQREGGPAERVAVTHPASWGMHKKDLLRAALGNQGQPVTFLAEPQAAAMHYAAAERVEPGSTIAVYDLGGGTFDAAVVHKADTRGDRGDNSRGFGLLGRPEGIERLGGVDFDEAVFEHVREGLPAAFEGLDEGDPAVLSAVASVRRECREAKEALSSDTEVSISVLMPAARGSVRLHRSEFEAMIRPQVEDTVAALRRAVTSAGLTPSQLSAVLLVGGSSRIPLVGQLVSEQLDRPVAVDADPKNAIAKGAALFLTPAGTTGTGAHVPAPRAPAPTRQPIGAGSAPPPARPAVFVPSGPRGGQRPGMPAAAAVVGGGVVGGGIGAAGSGAHPMTTPPAQRVSATGDLPPRMPAPPPPPRPAPSFTGSAAAYDQPSESATGRRPGRSPVLLVSAGAAAAAIAVIAAVFLWPKTTSTTTPIGVQIPQTSETVTVAPVIAPPAAEVPAPEVAPPVVGVDPTRAPVERTVAPPPPPPPVATAPPVVTTAVPPPPTTTRSTPPTTTAPTTTARPPTATVVPPPPAPGPPAPGPPAP